MKKFLLVVAMAFIASVSFAQSGKWAAGVNLGYGCASDISKPSIGVKALYNISDQFTLAPSFNYYFQKKYYDLKVNFWNLNCNLHWNVVSKENVRIYPLAGITYLDAIVSGDGEADGKFGANLGAGGQLNIGSNWAASLEVKYQIISETAQLVPSLSLMYRF